MVSPVFKNLLLVGLGSCLGGMARYIVSLLCQRSSCLIKADASFSMLIYLAGSLVGGFLMVLAGYALMKIL